MCFSRQTGALNRIIDRGSRAINYILTVMVFNVVPTILEVLTVTTLNCYCPPVVQIACDIVIMMLVAFGNLCHFFLWPLCELCLPCAVASYLQIGMVSSILAYQFGSTFAWITSVSVATYIVFTLAITQVRTLYSVITYVVLRSCFHKCSIYLSNGIFPTMYYSGSSSLCFHYDSGGLSSGQP